MIVIWLIAWLLSNTPALIHHGAFLGLSDWGLVGVIAAILL